MGSGGLKMGTEMGTPYGENTLMLSPMKIFLKQKHLWSHYLSIAVFYFAYFPVVSVYTYL